MTQLLILPTFMCVVQIIVDYSDHVATIVLAAFLYIYIYVCDMYVYIYTHTYIYMASDDPHVCWTDLC